MNARAGVVTGFVRAIDAARSRVQVEYAGMDQSLISPWASIAAPLSGKKRGMQFMPEPGDEVLVAFADGDFDHPYVIGFLWNGEQLAPEDDRDNRVIVTPGGHELRFEDKAGLKRIVLLTAAKRRITLDDSGAGHIEIRSGSHTVLLDDSGKIEATTGGGQKLQMVDVPATIKLSILSGPSIEISPEGITINSPMTKFTGAITAAGAVTTTSVISPLYTPGIGNLL